MSGIGVRAKLGVFEQLIVRKVELVLPAIATGSFQICHPVLGGNCYHLEDHSKYANALENKTQHQLTQEATSDRSARQRKW